MKKYIIISFILFISLNSFAIDRSIRPYSTQPPKIEFGKYEKFTTKNGITVLLVKNDRLPVLSISLDLKNSLYFDKNKAGLKNVVGELLTTGTLTRNNDALNEEIDYYGLDFNATGSSIRISGLSKYTDKMFELFADVTLNSNFKQEEFDKIIKRLIANLQQEDVNPNAIARRVSKKVFYGEDHPFAEVPSKDTYKNINIDDCRNYYKNYFVPNNVYITFVGNIDKNKAEQLVDKYFSKWQKKNIKETQLPKVPIPNTNQVIFVNREGAVQSNIVIGYPLYINYKNPDAPVLDLTNTILGGGVFRLFDNLREKHSYTYGAYSSISLSNPYVTAWRASADVKAKFTDSSVYQFLYEMERINKEIVPENELQLAKNYMIGEFARSLESPEEIANYVYVIERLGLPTNYFDNYIKTISKATSKDIMTAANKYIKYNKTNIIVVGDAKTNADKLKTFGTLVFYDIYGNPVKTENKKIESLNPKEIINKYIDAIGGTKAINNISTLVSTAKASLQTPQGEQTITLKNYRKSPNKMRIEITVMGMKQVIVFDGNKGYVESPMGKMDLPEEQNTDYAYEASLNPYENLDKFGIKVSFEGEEQVNKQTAYKLLFEKNDKKWYEFFDAKSGFKIKEIKTEEGPQGPVTTVTEYDNYKETNGIKYPWKIKQTVMGQLIEFTVENIEINSNIDDTLFQ